MKKTLSFAILQFFLISNSNAQLVLEGVVVNKENSLPLHGATVSIKDKFIGTTTGPDGYFLLNLHNVDLNDTLLVRYLGYYPFEQSVSEFIPTGKASIELKMRSFGFAEVAVKPSDLNLTEFMNQVIREYNSKRRRNPHIAQSHYREKATLGKKYIMFNEGIGYTLYLGEKERVAPLSNYEFIYDNTRLSTHSPEWRPLGEFAWRRVALGGKTPLGAFRSLEVYGLLEDREFDRILTFPQYRYRLDSTYTVNNQLVYRINFSSSIFNMGNNDEGTIDVFAHNYRILRIDYSGRELWSTIFHERVKGRIMFEFQYYDEQPYLSFARVYYDNDGYSHEIELNVLIQKFDEFNLEYNEFWHLKDYASYPFISYNEENWHRFNIKEDPDLDEINNDLKSINGIGIFNQFKENSGEWYITPHGTVMSNVGKGKAILDNIKQFF